MFAELKNILKGWLVSGLDVSPNGETDSGVFVGGDELSQTNDRSIDEFLTVFIIIVTWFCEYGPRKRE